MKDTVEDLCNQQQHDFEIKSSKVRGQVINEAHIRIGYMYLGCLFAGCCGKPQNLFFLYRVSGDNLMLKNFPHFFSF